ncbi:MAG: SMI1/KNR4 family protein [Planctomycetota bacterium]|jgi:hypothetical protein
MIDVVHIRHDLDRLRIADSEHQLFGAEEHRYVVRPRLSLTTINEFEARHRIELPDEYRLFLQLVGNGGAGPGYGLFALLAEIIAERSANPATTKRAKMQDWYFSSQHVNGSIPLCHEGCGYFDLLVLAGPKRGSIWIDGRASDGGIAPILDNSGNAHTFSGWYEEWLTTSLRDAGAIDSR